MKKQKHKAHKPAGVIELTEQNFASAIDGHPLAVVGFWAPSIANSRALVQAFAAAASRHPDVLFAAVDAEAQQAIAAQFEVQAVPTSIIFRHNVIVYARGGTPPPDALDKVLSAVRALETEPDAQAAADAPPADSASIEACLRPALRGTGSALAEIGPRLAAGELIAIRDAFEPDFAERMFRSLDQCAAWRVYEGYEADFHYHHHNLYRCEEYPQDMAWCAGLFDSPGTKAWVSRLSERDCVGPAEVGASWYLPGDHSLPHNDVAGSGPDLHRQVAFVWHLAKDWRPEWGGALFWCPTGSYVPPAFNTLFLFNVTPQSTHFVTHVSPYAQGKRLAINGWWTGPAATQSPVWTGPDRIATGSAEILVY